MSRGNNYASIHGPSATLTVGCLRGARNHSSINLKRTDYGAEAYIEDLETPFQSASFGGDWRDSNEKPRFQQW